MSNANESAFPTDIERYKGLTKRELFAAMAMHQLLRGAVLPTKQDRDEHLPIAGQVACEIADALLAALATPSEERKP